LREVLKITSHFCLLLDDWDCSTSFKEAYDLLTKADDETSICLLPYLSSISVKCNDLFTWFPEKATQELEKRIDDAPVFMNLVQLLIRTTQTSHALTSQISSLLYLFGKWNEESKLFYKNGWNIYLIGMEAGSCGWYELMHIVMRDLYNKVETEASGYWLKSLSTLALAECNLAKQSKLMMQGQGYISDVNDNFIKALTQFKAFQALEQPRVTQAWFIQLRMEMIIALQNTLYTLDKLTKNGTAATPLVMKRENKQLQQAAVTFRRLAFRYDFIAQSYFGIDKETLDVTEAYKTCALVCEHAARTFLRSGFFCIDPSLIPLMNMTRDDDLATQSLASKKHANVLINNCKEFIDIITKWEDYDHLEEQERRVTCGNDMHSIFQSLLGQPLILPKPFFKNRRNVSVQLTTDPPLSEQKPITLQLNEGLVIKFEGLLQMNQSIKNLEKKIKKAVIISFLTKERMAHLDDRMGVNMMFAEPLQIFNPNDEESILLQPPTVYMANVRNSYFTYTGLITLPRNALPNTKKEAWINIFVKLLDDNSGTWSVGPQLSGRLVW
ncbi:hypothetical protein K501DRAFT_203874, partial [Backusella circina FSU 941]